MKKIIIENFSLMHTLDSGQFFSYELIDDFYYITTPDTIFKIKQENNTLLYEGIKEKKLIRFFSLDVNLKEHTDNFDDQYLLEALEKYRGLRIMRQDLWQCIIGFVCSSCSNIVKIKKNMRMICEFFGNTTIIDGKEFYTFPKPGEIDDIKKLRDAKTGYRAEYLSQIYEIIKNNPSILDDIKTADYKTSKKLLMSFPGIGPKVADCICLFGVGHNEAFPIDTWVKKIIEELYLKRKAKNIKEIEEFIENYFDGNRGLKQQYLFHHMRNK